MIVQVEFDGTICPDARMVQPQTTPDEAVVAELRCYRSRGATSVVTSGRAGRRGPAVGRHATLSGSFPPTSTASTSPMTRCWSVARPATS